MCPSPPLFTHKTIFNAMSVISTLIIMTGPLYLDICFTTRYNKIVIKYYVLANNMYYFGHMTCQLFTGKCLHVLKCAEIFFILMHSSKKLLYFSQCEFILVETIVFCYYKGFYTSILYKVQVIFFQGQNNITMYLYRPLGLFNTSMARW